MDTTETIPTTWAPNTMPDRLVEYHMGQGSQIYALASSGEMGWNPDYTRHWSDARKFVALFERMGQLEYEVDDAVTLADSLSAEDPDDDDTRDDVEQLSELRREVEAFVLQWEDEYYWLTGTESEDR